VSDYPQCAECGAPLAFVFRDRDAPPDADVVCGVCYDLLRQGEGEYLRRLREQFGG
jgi:hypothetical protein